MPIEWAVVFVLEEFREHFINELTDTLDHKGISFSGPANDMIVFQGLNTLINTSRIWSSLSMKGATPFLGIWLLFIILISDYNHIYCLCYLFISDNNTLIIMQYKIYWEFKYLGSKIIHNRYLKPMKMD